MENPALCILIQDSGPNLIGYSDTFYAAAGMDNSNSSGAFKIL
jgi:hypothetical protein